MVTMGPSANEEGCNLGLARNVKSQDLLCQIPQTGKTFFLRRLKPNVTADVHVQHRDLHIAGTALVAQELFPPARRFPLRTSWDLTLMVDPETLYSLLK